MHLRSLCRLVTSAILSSIVPFTPTFCGESSVSEKAKWEDASLAKIISHYTGPTLPAGFLAEFSLFPDGTIKWIHSETTEQYSIPNEIINKKCMEAMKIAVEESNPLTNLPSNLRLERHVGSIRVISNGAKPSFVVHDYPGEFVITLQKDGTISIPATIMIPAPVVAKCSTDTSNKVRVFIDREVKVRKLHLPDQPIAIWFIVDPDGIVRTTKAVPVKVHSVKVKPSLVSSKAEKQLLSILKSKALPKLNCIESKPTAFVTTFLPNQAHRITVFQTIYEICPDLIQM